MKKGTVFDIQRFSLHDGPGVRTTVFLKGCPLRCLWCHNPEGLSPAVQIRYDSEKCIGCMDCTAICNSHKSADGRHYFDRTECASCKKCTGVCPTGALSAVGREMTADEVMEIVLKDKKYYKDGGGLTLSGGEPLLQSDFSLEILKIARENGINTAMETSGFSSPDVFSKVSAECDLVLFDIKLTDPGKHREYTGVSNEIILENLMSCTSPVILRCPVIPGINDNAEHFDGIAKLAGKVKDLKEIHIEPYHTLGLEKLSPLGMESAFRASPMTVPAAEEICEILRKRVKVPVKVSK